MLQITFKFKDVYTHGTWKTQTCVVPSIEECIRVYGLDEPNVDFEIIKVTDKED